jgi:hypothetical protein
MEAIPCIITGINRLRMGMENSESNNWKFEVLFLIHLMAVKKQRKKWEGTNILSRAHCQ